MKYELKGTYKFMLAIIFAVLFATTGIQFFINNKINDARNAMIMNYLPFLMMMFMLIIFGALIAATIFIINSYRKELYEDRGYLTFTLPLTGRQFLGSKLVVALFWYIAIAIALVIYNGILGTILFGNGWITQLFRVFNDYDFGIIAINNSIISILSSIITMLLVYFSITLSRVSFKNTKIGGIWFILFLLFKWVYSFLNHWIIIKLSDVDNLHSYMTSAISVPSIIFSIIVGIGLFLGTSYLIEKKIDL
jgi:hypothetical protein